MISDSISLSFKYNSLETALREGEPQLSGPAAGEMTAARASYM